jgi:hypothetical protein
MPSWDSIAQRDVYKRPLEAFEEAAYRVIAEQVLYHADKGSRATYWIVEQYEKDFRDALNQVGVDLRVNREKRYVVATPRYGAQHAAPMMATLVALVLRRLYDEFARQGNMSDDGEVFVDLVDFEEKFRLITNRQLPARTDFEQTMRLLKRWGIVRKTTDEEYVGDSANGYAIAIRPGIIDVLGEIAIARLVHWEESAPAKAASAQEIEQAQSDEEIESESSLDEESL